MPENADIEKADAKEAAAEQKKSERQAAAEQRRLEKLSEKNQRRVRNMQINYYIMRKLYAEVRGRERTGDNSGFHRAVLSSSRIRINRVIKGEDTHFTPVQINEYVKTTGVPAEYFKGEKRMVISTAEGTDEKWESFCEARHSGNGYEDIQKDLDGMIKRYYSVNAKRKLDTSNALSLYIHFLKNKAPYNNQAAYIAKNTVDSIAQDRLEVLQSLGLEYLEYYVKVLAYQHTLASAVLTIKRDKDERKKRERELAKKTEGKQS
jgi:hypothetical protein